MKHLKVISVLLALCMVLCAFAACAGKTDEPDATAADATAADATAAPADTDGKTFTVGICQLVQHEALDAATKGFKDALTEALGDSVTFDEQNAAGDSATCATIVNSFVSKNVDLIMANATPALQAAYNATETIPVLGTSITEYGTALELSDFNGTVGGNVSGTSDLAPLDEQAQMLVDLFPDAQKVGLLYCSGEPNSAYQVKVVREELEAKGIEVTDYSFADSNDINAVLNKAVTEVDVIYIPTDNTAANSAELIGNIVREAKIPVIAGEEGICKACGVATLTISYYDLGVKTGEMAARILKGEADISTMAIEYAPVTKKYNKAIADELGIEIPEDYEAIEAAE
ncbi:MAG: ABC transporter substrate-binding protein [Clostridia bacterium]|nr:ABC transporter substrate-binding protein [Clostridia bacterium]